MSFYYRTREKIMSWKLKEKIKSWFKKQLTKEELIKDLASVAKSVGEANSSDKKGRG